MKLGVQGILTIVEHRLDRHLSVEEAEALARDGADVRVRHVRNHIADTGLDALAALVGGGYGSPMVGSNTYDEDTVAAIDAVSPSGAFIGEMRLGTVTSPPAPTDADTGLYGPTAYSVRSDLSVPGLLVSSVDDEVRFSCFLPAGFLDGQTITEEGIFTFDGDLFARIALDPTFTISSEYGVQFIHRVRFVTYLARTPINALITGAIDINPDLLGSPSSGRVITDIIDVAVDITGDLDVPLVPVWGINNTDGSNNAGLNFPTARNWYVGGLPAGWWAYGHTYDYIRSTISSMMYRDSGLTRVGVRFDGTQVGVSPPPNYNRVDVHVISTGTRILGFGDSTDGVKCSLAGSTMTVESAVGGVAIGFGFPFTVGQTLGLVFDSINDVFRILVDGGEVSTIQAPPALVYFNQLGNRADWNLLNIDYQTPAVQRVDSVLGYDDPTVRV